MRKILILAVNPKDTNRLRLDEEVRDIKEGIKRSQQRDDLSIVSEWAIRARDLRRLVLDHKPQIIHFSGHGEGKDGLCFEDKNGYSKKITGSSLKALFKLLMSKASLECVVLNGCYSQTQSQAISECVPYVIGMTGTVSDQLAIEFAVGFYDALGNGESIEFAFECGQTAMQLDGADLKDLPILTKRKGLITETSLSQRDSQTAKPKPISHVRLVASKDKQLGKQLLIVDREIAARWTAQPDEIFLPQLTFIDHMTNAIPGSIALKDSDTITFAGKNITPLLPINPILLEYLSLECLSQNLKFRQLESGEDTTQVEVILNLTLAGIKNHSSHQVSRTYTLDADNALDGVPVLDIWPNIKSESWHEYYGFYYDSELGEDTFQVAFSDPEDYESFNDDQGGMYLIAKFKKFPSYIICRRAGEIVGVIILDQPEMSRSKAKKWKIKIDYGTSTNILLEQAGSIEQLQLEPLNLKVVDSPPDTRFTTLLEYFIPENFIPIQSPLPFRSILTKRGSGQCSPRKERPIIDGRIYIPNLSIALPSTDWIIEHLGWKSTSSVRLFVSHIILLVSSLAMKKGVNTIEWVLLVPLSLSKEDTRNYVEMWNGLLSTFSNSTGITNIFFNDSDSSHDRRRSDLT